MIVAWIQPMALVSSWLEKKRCSEVTAFASFVGNGQQPTDTIGLNTIQTIVRSLQMISLCYAVSAMVSRQPSAASLDPAETSFTSEQPSART